MIHNIPLNRLVLSELNVRKTERDAEIASLAGDIEARGLKQNLVVVAIDGTDQFEVVAGGRRLQALKLLVEQGKRDADLPIPCLEEPREEGVETSLSENLHRVAMNPADEFDAFRTIIEQQGGETPEALAYCAKRFGVTEQHVKGRLRLARLVPEILEALRAGTIGLSAAMAYASVDDKEAQDRVWKINTKPNAWNAHDPRRVRDELTKRTYGLNDPKVKLVGLKAYADAGGRTDTDLFSTDSSERLIDPSIIDKLVTAAFEKQAPKLAKKLGVTGVILDASQWGNGGKAPDGWASKYDDGSGTLTKRIKAGKPTMLSVRLTDAGKFERGEYNRYYYVPQAEIPAEPAERSRADVDWEARHAAEQKERHIELEAIKLAVPKGAGTPFENRIFLPASLSYVRYDDSNDGKEIYVEFKLRLTREEVDAQMEAAVPAYEAALAAKAEREAEAERRKAAIKAEQDALVAAMLEGEPPAVVDVDECDEVLFRWSDGRFASIREADAGDDDDDFWEYESLQEIADDATVVRYWLTVEAYEADMKTGIPGTCRVCGCTENNACDPPCGWQDDTRTLCDNPECVMVAAAAEPEAVGA